MEGPESLIPGYEFAGNRLCGLTEIHARVLDEVPQVVEVAGLVPGPVQEGHHLLRRDLPERVDLDPRALGQVLVFGIASQNGALLDGKTTSSRIVMSTFTSLPAGPPGNGPS